MAPDIDRRLFMKQLSLGASAAACANPLAMMSAAAQDGDLQASTSPIKKPYTGPNVIVIRFGGGVRRRETIDLDHTYCPFISKTLAKQATLHKDMVIDQFTTMGDNEKQIDTSHGQGTLHILTGQYNAFENRRQNIIGEDFEPTIPTLFEYLRHTYDVPEHQTLIINNENRVQEEFFTSSNHHQYGIDYQCGVLSLYRFKRWLFAQQIAEGHLTGEALKEKKKELSKLENVDTARGKDASQTQQIKSFWQRWRKHYGDSGFVNPRGDRLLTELAVRAIKELQPRMMMINYTDPDYVHWGYLSHYTRAISIIDQGVRRLVNTVAANEQYRDNTVFVLVPDCGRDNNRMMHVPCQHHFNSNESRRIFSMMWGKGIERGVVVDKQVQQIQIASTVGQLMGFKTAQAEQAVLEEALA